MKRIVSNEHKHDNERMQDKNNNYGQLMSAIRDLEDARKVVRNVEQMSMKPEK